MKLNLKLYLKTMWFSLFKSEGTPGRLTPKRFFILLFIFILYPFWHFSIRLAYGLDQLFFPQHIDQDVSQPIFIVGNFRSGTTLLHRLLVKDAHFTSMTSWEIYLAPTIVQRKVIRWMMKINRIIGNPIQKIINRFEKALKQYSYMHPTALNEVEEDGQILLHIWSTYNIFAFFPFPDLIKNYIYYDEEVTEEQKEVDMSYYREVLKRHVFANGGKQYIAKNPSFSPKVRTLHQKFPDAKFINLVRSPLRVIPSSVSMFSNHWQTYGEPTGEYPEPGPEIMQEQAKHWYVYPHKYLKNLPPEQYMMVRYQDLVADPQKTVENIYNRFGITITEEFQQVLQLESEKAKHFKSKHHYSLRKMGLDSRKLKKDFKSAIKEFKI